MTRDIGAEFRDLHRPGQPFILANAWDIGSAKVLGALGAQAIATSSSAYAFTLGRPDTGKVSRDESLGHASDLVSAVNLPVSGDFENGFGDAPEICAQTVRLSAEVGLAGISIEDTALPSDTPYAFDLAVERIRAAAAAARALKSDFVLVARADGIMNSQYDIKEALRRLTAFEDAGADCLYAPMTATMDDLTRICASTKLPVNGLAAGSYSAVSKADFAAAGIARISIGGGLSRVTQRVIAEIGKAMFDNGDFSGLGNAISEAEINALFDKAP